MLWRVQRSAGDLIAATSTHLRLATGVVVDACQAAARARCVLADVPSDRRDVRALSLAGDLLPDWYDDWVLIEQEQIRQLRLHTLESLDGLAGREESARAAAEIGDYRDSVANSDSEGYDQQGCPPRSTRGVLLVQPARGGGIESE